MCDDSDWARTSDLYPVKVALSQLSYGINLGWLLVVLSSTFTIIQGEEGKVNAIDEIKLFRLYLAFMQSNG